MAYASHFCTSFYVQKETGPHGSIIIDPQKPTSLFPHNPLFIYGFKSNQKVPDL